MVTSHELLDFVDKCTESDITLDSQGDVLSSEGPLLEGKPLATAIAAIASLSVAEHDNVLQTRSLELHHDKKDKTEDAGSSRGYV